MKINIPPHPVHHRRGEAARVGKVYATPRQNYVRVCVGIKERTGNRPWGNIFFLHVSPQGEIVGASSAPQDYVRNHYDCVGQATFGDMHIIWN